VPGREGTTTHSATTPPTGLVSTQRRLGQRWLCLAQALCYTRKTAVARSDPRASPGCGSWISGRLGQHAGAGCGTARL